MEKIEIDTETVEAAYNALLIPIASRVYALGMGRREVDLKAASNSRRSNDAAISFQSWKKYRDLGR